MTSPYDPKPWLLTCPEWFVPVFPEKPDTVPARFRRIVESDPDAVCIHYFNVSYSYLQIHEMASALAANLEQQGLGPGDRMLLVMQNIPQAVIASLGAWMCGATVVPVNPMYTAREIEVLLKDSGAKIILCEDLLFDKAIEPIAENRPVISTSPLDFLGNAQDIPEQLRHAERMPSSRTTDFMELIGKSGHKEKDPYPNNPEDVAYLVYTSGTTGPPKGAMVSHANIDHTCRVYEAGCRLDRSDVVLGVAPLFHITGIVAHLAIAFHLGVAMVLHNRFDPAEVLRLIEKYRVTFTVASITVYIALLNSPACGCHDVSHFRKAYSGGAPVAPGTVEKFRQAMGIGIHNVYGLTESTSPATLTPLGEQGPVDAESGALSVGLVIPGLEAWIVDVQDPEKILPPGEEGELVLRGPSIVRGYWQKPEETAAAIQNDRFFTGDVAKIDEKGWCYIVDRKKDLINVSGFKVWPRDVEDALYQHPAVKEAAVIGVPDEYRGETVKAFVSLNADYAGKVEPDELVRFCRERMAAYKYPRIIEIIDELPKTPTGKILRRQLRSDGKGAS